MAKKDIQHTKQTPNSSFGMAGALTIARVQVGGDWAAALLLYRLKWRWQMKSKLKRLGREWIAMSRSNWAWEAGLSEAEMKNRALPKLRKCAFVTIRQMKLGEKKLLWMSLDLAELYSPIDLEFAQLKLNGLKGIGYEKGVGSKIANGNYPYKKTSEDAKYELLCDD